MAKEKRSPINTTKEVRDDAVGFLASAMVMGGSEAILHQESQGQKSLVNSDTLPTEIGRYSDYNEKAILKAAGVKFLGVVEGDKMFQYVELPKGWKKEATDHSMWSKLVDDKGRERASIFYKAAFYDRSAHMNLTNRFEYGIDYDREEKDNVAVAYVKDCGKIVHTTEPIKLPEDRKERYALQDKAKALAEAWLNKHYPSWRNPGAYWD